MLVSVLSSTTLINEVHVAYSEIMKILLQVTAVNTVGRLMAVVCSAIQGDSCADFASLHVAMLDFFPFVFSHQCQLLKHV